MSGICAITTSGICPFNFSSLNELGGIATVAAATVCEGAPPANILLQVPSPTNPSAVKPLAACHSFTAFSVPGPKLPSADSPNFSWSFLTSSPLDPTFSSIVNNF